MALRVHQSLRCRLFSFKSPHLQPRLVLSHPSGDLLVITYLPDQDPVTEQPSMLQQTRNKLAEPVVAAFMAGGVAGAVSRTIVSPLERLKILLQIQSVGREEYKLSIWRALVKMGKEEGWRGFMRGNGTNCIRIIPYSAVQFGSYNFYKRVCRKNPPPHLKVCASSPN